MNFSKEQIEFMKNASDHVDRLCGGRGYGKTHQLIKEMEDKIYQLQSNWNSLREFVEYQLKHNVGSSIDNSIINHVYQKIRDKMNELEGDK